MGAQAAAQHLKGPQAFSRDWPGPDAGSRGRFALPRPSSLPGSRLGPRAEMWAGGEGTAPPRCCPHLIDAEADGVHVLAHLPLASPVLLDEAHQEGAAALPILLVLVFLLQLDQVLRVHPEGVCGQRGPGCITQEAGAPGGGAGVQQRWAVGMAGGFGRGRGGARLNMVGTFLYCSLPPTRRLVSGTDGHHSGRGH